MDISASVHISHALRGCKGSPGPRPDTSTKGLYRINGNREKRMNEIYRNR